MSEQDLQRLADILKSRGEGLAAINPNEANLLQALGGAAQPLPGTQGMGPGGGPIRSYKEEKKEKDPAEAAGGYGKYTGGDPPAKPDQGLFETRIDVIAKRKTKPDDDSDKGTTTTTTTAPPKYYDQFGNEYTTQALATQADNKITIQQGNFKTYLQTNLKSDTDFETFKTKLNEAGQPSPELTFDQWKATNPGGTQQEYDTAVQNGTIKMVTQSLKGQNYNLLPDDEIERLFNEQKILVAETAKTQVAGFTDTVSGILQTFNEQIDQVTGLPVQDIGTLTFDDIQSQLPATGFEVLSDLQKRGIFKKLQDNAVKVGRFTLTPAERAQFETPAPTAATVTDATAPTVATVTDATAPVVTGTGTVTAPTITAPAEIVAPTVSTTMPTVTAPTLDTVGDITAPTAGDVTVGEAEDPAKVIIDEIIALDISDIDAIEDLDDIRDKLKARVSGEATSPAEIQLTQTTQNNVRQLLGLEAGATADPAKLRQIRQLYAETQQAASGQSALLRSQEMQQAEQALIDVAKTKGAMEMEAELANLETRRQVAIQEGDFESARQLQIAQASLTRVITQANIERDLETAELDVETRTRIANLDKEIRLAIKKGDMEQAAQQANQKTALEIGIAQADVETRTRIANLETERILAIAQGEAELAADIENQKNTLMKNLKQADLDLQTTLANLESRRILAVEQGKLDLAVALGNLEKEIILSRTNAELALKSKALDDAVALSAFEGLQSLEGIDLKVDLAELEADLTTAGFKLQLQLKDMDIGLQKYLAAETAKLKALERGTDEYGAQLKLIGTLLTAANLIKSDISAKRNIRAADDQVEGFLDALNSYQYEYKDENAPGADAGMFVGVMAQDLEKTPMGASFVKDTPQGKMVDYGHGLAAILASQSNLHDRLRQLEEG